MSHSWLKLSKNFEFQKKKPEKKQPVDYFPTFQAGEVEVKTKNKKKKRKREREEAKKSLYTGFTKSATLANGNLVEEVDKDDPQKDSSDEDDVEAAKISAIAQVISDEELFKAAGITAHKGARHGVTMEAKLRRVEMADKEYLEKVKSKKKKKKKDKE